MSRVDSQAEDLFSQNENDPAVELKGSVFTLPVLRLRSSDLHAIDADLKERLAQGLRFFENAPVVIDLEPLREQSGAMDFAALAALLRDRRLVPVGVRHANHEQNEAALAAGLASLKGGVTQDLAPVESKPAADASPSETQNTAINAAAPGARVVQQPVRSGQRIYAAGDLIVLAPVNAGAEIIAEGNIHVYAPLRGRALAGVKGNEQARIFARTMEAELVAVAGQFRVFEDRLPEAVHGKSAQVYLSGEQLVVEALG